MTSDLIERLKELVKATYRVDYMTEECIDVVEDAIAELQSRQWAEPDKIVQVSGFGVNNTINTQCDYMLVGLTASGRVVMSDGGRTWCDVSPIPPSQEPPK